MDIQILIQRLQKLILKLVKNFRTWVADPRSLSNIILAIGFITNVSCNIHYDLYDNGNGNVWFFGNSFAFFCYAYALYRLLPNLITSIILGAVTQQFLDELINDPTKNPLIEYLGFILLISILYYNVRRKRRSIIKIYKGERDDN